MNKLLLIASLLLSITTPVLSQDFDYPGSGLYYYNYSLANPAHIGLNNEFSATTSFNTGGIGSNHPLHNNFGISLLVENKISKINSGIGGTINFSALGPTHYLNIAPIYSYQIRVNDKTQVSIGMRLKNEIFIIDHSYYAQIYPNDPLIADLHGNEYQSALDLDLGVVLQIKNTTIGLSGRNLLESKFPDLALRSSYQNMFQLTAFFQQDIQATENLTITPSAFFTSNSDRSSLDVNTIVKIKNTILVGCRLASVNNATQGVTLSASAGVNINDIVQLMTLVYSNVDRNYDGDGNLIRFNLMARVRINKS